jgi:hypothetical protein
MSDTASKHQENESAWILDVFVVIFCLLGAAASLYMFQHDVFNSSSENLPAGTVTEKYNTVERRFKDRNIWDRLAEGSAVYIGDRISVNRLSGAVIAIDNNNIELGENTIIEIHRDEDSAKIEFVSGEVNVKSRADGGMILLSIGERVVQASSGTAFSASSAGGDVVLHVTEGTARIISGGQAVSAPAGTVTVQDGQGREITRPMASVTQPRPNARYVKTGDLPVNVRFEWLRINMRGQDRVRLEIAEDRNFTRLSYAFNDLDSSVSAALNSGLWYWRLLSDGTVLNTGRLNITETAPPSLYNAEVSGSDVQLRWSSVEEASGYFLQVSAFADFLNPVISTQVQGTAFVMPNPDYGTWYWRVRPFFPSVYEGAADFSQASSFQIERNEALPSLSLIRPAHESVIAAEETAEGVYFSWSNSREAASYTIQIFSQDSPGEPVVKQTANDNFFVYGGNEAPLVSGRYYWSVSYTDARGNLSPPSQTRSFIISETAVNQRLVFPPDRYNADDGQISALRFSWETNLSSDRRFQVSVSENFFTMIIDAPADENFYQGVSVPPGEWYWRISARQSSMSQAFTTPPRRFTVTGALAQPAPEAVEEETGLSPAPLRLRLVSPSQGSSIAGLTALRQPTVFRWECDEELASSRFVLSRNANPEQGRPEREIINPGRTIMVDALAEGLWYWTIIAQSRDGRPVTSVTPGQFRVQPVPLMPAPGNRQPESGYRIGAEELRRQRNIIFRWNAVEGATSYILAIYRETPQGRRQIFRTGPLRQPGFTFENLSLFDYSGTYVWQVEALYYNRNGNIEQHGRPGENTFTLNVPRPGRVNIRDTGILYGN